MDSEVGQSGLEEAYEEYLHGTDGWREDTVATDGTLISSRYLTEPKAGSNVEVSIDTGMQTIAETQLASVIQSLRAQEPNDDGRPADGHDAEGGCVVAIEVDTGQVLVCANYPTYNPATYYDEYDKLLEADYKPLTNRALINAYPPGSTYKMIPTVAALENGIISTTTEIVDQGLYTKYSDLYLKCMIWSESGGGTHGALEITRALMYSCNYFFYELGDMMDIEIMDDVAAKFGLGEPTGVELPEVTGTRANPETKKELYFGSDQNWNPGDSLTAAIGQSDNRFTTMQLAVYAATLASHGTRYKATFMNRVVSSDYRELLAENTPKVVSKMDLNPLTVDAYTEGMKLVVNHPDGTGFSQLWQTLPVSVAGKTGTAEHAKGKSDHGAFVCFAPAEDPEIAIAVYVECGGHGSSLVSIARLLINEYYRGGAVSDVETYENRIC